MNNIMRGHLKLVILSSLQENEMSGSEIMKKIESEFGWKPSCGSVYPILNHLEDEKFTQVKNSVNKSHKKIYYLTSKGKIELKKKKAQKKDLADEIIRIHKMVASLYNVDIDKMESMMRDMERGRLPFAQIHGEIEELKFELFRIDSEDILKTKSEEVRRILKRTIIDLKKVSKDKVSKDKIFGDKVSRTKIFNNKSKIELLNDELLVNKSSDKKKKFKLLVGKNNLKRNKK